MRAGSNCTSTGKYLYAAPSDYPEGCTPMEPTNNEPAHRSWDPHGHSKHGDFTKHNPWRAPGHAPVVDPCGDASGYLPGAQKGAAIPEGYAAFSRGSEVLPEGDVTVWRSGGSAEVAWAIAAQHGGGYSYRICPKKAGQVLSEECFQAHPLEFTGATHTIRYNDGSRKDFAINASTVSEGTKPAGSSWRRNPSAHPTQHSLETASRFAWAHAGSRSHARSSGVQLRHWRGLLSGRQGLQRGVRERSGPDLKSGLSDGHDVPRAVG